MELILAIGLWCGQPTENKTMISGSGTYEFYNKTDECRAKIFKCIDKKRAKKSKWQTVPCTEKSLQGANGGGGSPICIEMGASETDYESCFR